MKPEFICIGAMKAGTSWLFRRLREHPEFSLPPVKEMHYFDRSSSYPSLNTLAETKLLSRLWMRDYIRTGAKAVFGSLKSRNVRLAKWWMLYYFHNFSDKWYIKLYEMQPGITGDITPGYSILNREDVERIQKVAPRAKLIFLIRNPIERAWSHYRFTEKLGGSIELDNLAGFKAFIDSSRQSLRSDYLRTIDLYLEVFDSSQLILGFYDAIQDQPEALLSGILDHIGAKNTAEHGRVSQVVNRSREVEIPESYRKYLESKYYGELKELSNRYGSYASKWFSRVSDEESDQENGVELSAVVYP
ncbi:MAG: sulfotransferase [Verrucomicrobiota bacterium]